MSDVVAATASTAALRPRKATAADLPAVAETLALAFYDDPVVSWCVEDGARRRQLNPAVFGAVAKSYLAVEPHYYLFLLGTRPESQGHGLGSSLMAPVLERCDRDRVPAYLEATSERNVPLYLRHGFEVTAEIQIPGGPKMWPMWRAPK